MGQLSNHEHSCPKDESSRNEDVEMDEIRLGMKRFGIRVASMVEKMQEGRLT